MRFTCDHCQYKTNHKGRLSCHVREKHLPQHPNLNVCNKCEKNYTQPSSLLRHSKFCGLTKEAKTSLMSFTCDHCNYRTHHKTNLSSHIQVKHLPRDLSYK